MKHWRALALGAAGSLLAVLFVFTQMGDLSQLGAALAAARYGYLIPAVFLIVIGLACRAVRWRVLLSGGLPLHRAFSILNVAYLVNGVLPLRIGEVARAYLATRADPPVPFFKSASTILVERLLDLLAVLVILLLAVSAAPLPDAIRAAALTFAPLAVIGFGFLVALAARRALALRIIGWLSARIGLLRRVNAEGLTAHFLDGLLPLARPATFILTLLWTGISWAVSIASGYVLMYAFYDRPDLAATMLFTAAASFAVAVPAVPGNVGPYEASIVLALGALGYGEPAATAVGFALVVHFANLAVNAVLGVLGFFQEGITLEQLAQGVRGVQSQTQPVEAVT
ncbi:MAG: lysylphosphatidylglycerol synthase transmembrane domain-containing protein [Candidatus Flexifilum sp.]|jgi:uncharacterized protein (TIRG00374 family)